MQDYYNKYIKYKIKYNRLKNSVGGINETLDENILIKQIKPIFNLDMQDYYNKYIKYKTKYIEFKNNIGGAKTKPRPINKNSQKNTSPKLTSKTQPTTAKTGSKDKNPLKNTPSPKDTTQKSTSITPATTTRSAKTHTTATETRPINKTSPEPTSKTPATTTRSGKTHTTATETRPINKTPPTNISSPKPTSPEPTSPKKTRTAATKTRSEDKKKTPTNEITSDIKDESISDIKDDITPDDIINQIIPLVKLSIPSAEKVAALIVAINSTEEKWNTIKARVKELELDNLDLTLGEDLKVLIDQISNDAKIKATLCNGIKIYDEIQDFIYIWVPNIKNSLNPPSSSYNRDDMVKIYEEISNGSNDVKEILENPDKLTDMIDEFETKLMSILKPKSTAKPTPKLNYITHNIKNASKKNAFKKNTHKGVLTDFIKGVAKEGLNNIAKESIKMILGKIGGIDKLVAFFVKLRDATTKAKEALRLLFPLFLSLLYIKNTCVSKGNDDAEDEGEADDEGDE